MNRRLKSRLMQFMPRWLTNRAKKLYYPWLFWRWKESDWPASAVVRKLIRPGDAVVDAGANIGYLTLLFSRWVGDEGRVYSIEPMPDTVDLLAHNLKALRLRNVTLLPFALSAEAGRAEMVIPRYANGGENLYESRISPGDGTTEWGRTVQVEMATLDLLLEGMTHDLTFIKIDVEGQEWEALQGAAKTVAQFTPALLVEVSGDPDEQGSAAHHLFSLLGEQGYAPYLLDGCDVRVRKPGELAVDYFFLMPKHLEQIRGD